METARSHCGDRYSRSYDISRVISIGNWQSDACNESFKAVWAKLCAAEEIKCAKTAITHDALPEPQAAIVDVRYSVPYESVI